MGEENDRSGMEVVDIVGDLADILGSTIISLKTLLVHELIVQELLSRA